jgi:hypothetical protein
MKVVIPSYQRPDALTTPYLDVFENFDKYILVHNEQELSDYKKHNPNLNIICTDIDVALGGGLPRQRKWAIDNLVKHDEWIVFADDNIKEIHGITNNTWHQDEITQPNTYDWSNVGEVKFVERINYLTNYADTNNAYHIGFLPAHNYYFARRKVKHFGFCMGKMTLWKKDNNFVWNNIYLSAMEDFNHTAMHLVNYGIVIVHDYMYPHAYHYQKGGEGSREYRKPIRVNSIKVLTTLYPNLIKKKLRKDGYPDARIVYMSKKNFIIWRNKYKEFVKNYTYDIDKYKWFPNDMS